MLRVGRTMLVDRASIFVQRLLDVGIVPLTLLADENIAALVILRGSLKLPREESNPACELREWLVKQSRFPI